MPWLRQVWKLGKFRLMKSHADEYFVEWGNGRTTRIPQMKLPTLFGRRRRGA